MIPSNYTHPFRHSPSVGIRPDGHRSVKWCCLDAPALMGDVFHISPQVSIGHLHVRRIRQQHRTHSNLLASSHGHYASYAITIGASPLHATRCKSKITTCRAMTDTNVYQVPDADEDDDTPWDPTTLKALVVGAGPTGLLVTHYLARRGYQVYVYDKGGRPTAGDAASCPLFLTSRGNAAMEELQLELMRAGVQAPTLEGTWDVQTGILTPTEPTTSNSRLYVMDRSGLVEELIREAERMHPDKVHFHFGTELRRVSFKNRQAWFQPTGSSEQELDKGMEMEYDLIIGADGANSSLRGFMQAQVKDFGVQYPIRDSVAYKTFHNLSLPAAADAFLPGLQQHTAQEYLYTLQGPGSPTITMFKDPTGAFHGTISGASQWQEAMLMQLLTQTYPKLPLEWASAIAHQTCEAVQPQERTHYMVQCNQFHGPRAVLVGDAAHAVTSVLKQGPSSSLESVRSLRLVLRGLGDNLDKIPEVYNMYRRDAMLAMQFLEFAKATTESPSKVAYNGGLFRFTAFFTRIYWGLASIVGAILNKVSMGNCLTVPEMLTTLKDRRMPYEDVTKMIRTYALPPVVVSVAVFLTYVWVNYLSVV